MMRGALRPVFVALILLGGCAPGFKSDITPIKSPSSYPTSYSKDGLQIGFHFLTVEDQKRHFGVDMSRADVVPLRVVVRNDSKNEYYIKSDQIFGRTPGGDLYPAYRLDQSVQRVRQSEIGRAMAAGAATGLIVGAAIGAAAGAAIGQATADSPGQGAAIGAAVGGTGGGLRGAAVAADGISRAIQKELRKVDWGSRVVYPGHIIHGFIFMKPGISYEALEILLHNVNERRFQRVSVGIK